MKSRLHWSLTILRKYNLFYLSFLQSHMLYKGVYTRKVGGTLDGCYWGFYGILGPAHCIIHNNHGINTVYRGHSIQEQSLYGCGSAHARVANTCDILQLPGGKYLHLRTHLASPVGGFRWYRIVANTLYYPKTACFRLWTKWLRIDVPLPWQEYMRHWFFLLSAAFPGGAELCQRPCDPWRVGKFLQQSTDEEGGETARLHLRIGWHSGVQSAETITQILLE